jgi:hypothetical protein
MVTSRPEALLPDMRSALKLKVSAPAGKTRRTENRNREKILIFYQNNTILLYDTRRKKVGS